MGSVLNPLTVEDDPDAPKNQHPAKNEMMSVEISTALDAIPQKPLAQDYSQLDVVRTIPGGSMLTIRRNLDNAILSAKAINWSDEQMDEVQKFMIYKEA